jgi:hypothetical protein
MTVIIFHIVLWVVFDIYIFIDIGYYWKLVILEGNNLLFPLIMHSKTKFSWDFNNIPYKCLP